MNMTDSSGKRKEPRKPRELEELKGASDRLFYEWRMLVGVEQALASHLLHDHLILRNALIEAGAIHSRNLVHFFYGYELWQEKKEGLVKPDDMVAEDFFHEEGGWREARGSRPDVLESEELVSYVHKQVAHMVYPQRDKKAWDFVKITDALQPALEMFVGMLDEEQMGDRWKGLLERPEGSVGPRWQRLRSLIQAKVQSSS